MVQITLLTVGTLKEAFWLDAMAEYRKRLSAYAKFEEITLKEERIADEDDQTQIKSALEREGEKILAALPKDAYKIALCVEGKEMNSETLAQKIGEAADRTGKIALVIGSSHGLAPAVKEACDLRLSVSQLTFPHQLMRVMLLEILYRSFSMLAGKRYHK